VTDDVSPWGQVAAVVVAGGRSSRFGGDKLTAEVGGRPLVRHALDAAREVTEQLIVVGPASEALPDDVAVVREDPPYAGPYAAVAAGLTAIADDVDVVLVLAGDLVDPAPLLPLLLDALRGPQHTSQAGLAPEAAVALDADGRRQPLLAAYRVDPLLAGMAGVDAQGRAAYALLDGLRVVDVPDPGSHSRDVDTPADLA
jgi:molybdopterin-guanine dinucleotide biosynthesis protein A